METRITVPLLLTEKAALMKLAERERRAPRAQAAMLIRRELERLGLIQTQQGQGVRDEQPA